MRFKGRVEESAFAGDVSAKSGGSGSLCGTNGQNVSSTAEGIVGTIGMRTSVGLKQNNS